MQSYQGVRAFVLTVSTVSKPV